MLSLFYSFFRVHSAFPSVLVDIVKKAADAYRTVGISLEDSQKQAERRPLQEHHPLE